MLQGDGPTDYSHHFFSKTIARLILAACANPSNNSGILFSEVDSVPFRANDRYFRRTVDMRYRGQFHEVEVDVPGGLISQIQLDEVINRFHEKHESLYAYRDIVETEIMNLRLTGFGKVTKQSLKAMPYQGKDANKHIIGKREVFFEEIGDFTLTSIYDGDALGYGNLLEGPAVVEQKTTTIVIPPGYTLEVGNYGDYIMQVPE